MLGKFLFFCPLLIFFSKSSFSKNYFESTIRLSNSFDPDQVRHLIGPDLGPNCLQRLSADGTSYPLSTTTNRQRMKVGMVFVKVNINKNVILSIVDCRMAKKHEIMFSIGEDEDEVTMTDSASGSSVSNSIPIPGSLGRDLQSPTNEEKTAIQTIAASAAELSMSPRTFLR